METLSQRLYGLISQGVKMTGTYNPDETLPAFEEQLTLPEAEEIEKFLQWCHDNGKAFGHGNYQERFAEFKEGKEKNITTRIYTYDVELDVSYDGGDLVSSCFISKTRDGTLYCSSLALLSDQGTIEGDNWGDVIHVPDKIITKIHHWAEDNGY